MSILKQLKNVFINDGTINGSNIEYGSLLNIVAQMNEDPSVGEFKPFCDTYTRSVCVELKIYPINSETLDLKELVYMETLIY